MFLGLRAEDRRAGRGWHRPRDRTSAELTAGTRSLPKRGPTLTKVAGEAGTNRRRRFTVRPARVAGRHRKQHRRVPAFRVRAMTTKPLPDRSSYGHRGVVGITRADPCRAHFSPTVRRLATVIR